MLQLWLFVLLGGALGGWIAWSATRTAERNRFTGRVKALETKLRLTQGEAGTLREELQSAKQELALVDARIESVRLEKLHAISRLHHKFRKTILFVGTVYLGVGLAGGGILGWQTASWKHQAEKTSRTTELQLTAELSKLKAELFEKELKDLRASIQATQREIMEERVLKAIAQTKLSIFLESLSRQKGVSGFVVDYEKLRDNLRKETPLQEVVMEPLSALTPARV
ncbi:MAG: hypothetical protein JW893_04100 [Candidatus Omnitrophica bacterium]|nr:hypothetical protein [Candidatus Omnitrophota bacterium]